MRFDTVLIANRGEIALRVIKSARRMGLRTVAVYSDADAEAPHVRAADLAVRIGPADANLSYRNIPAILEACRKSGAQAVHPGYGFLSERAEFAQAVTDAGLFFIGPSARVIDLMGNKAQAKTAMQAAGVPTVPGVQDCTTEAQVQEAARTIGYPLIFKAAAGGGGRGMRISRYETTLLEMFRQARSEALSAFGSDEILIERAIQDARHIEIQVLCDERGNCLHLGERDCSMQRRFQKVVEEAPSPGVSAEQRETMGEIARRACAAISYVGVGTLEFLLEPGGGFYFMEMNTRLQVEHGVTELVTGIDLVEQQLRVAQGESLALEQKDIRWSGHAIELRVCAEDPLAGFLPQVGRIDHWQAPPDIRVDTAMESGMVVSPYYDSMVGKLLAWAPNRAECIARLTRACENTVLLGIPTNLGFLERCINHPTFKRGEVHTAFLGQQDLSDSHWTPQPSVHGEVTAALILSAAIDVAAKPGVGGSMVPPFELMMVRSTDSQQANRSNTLAVHVVPPERSTNAWSISMKSLAVDEAERCLTVSGVKRDGDRFICIVDGIRRSLAVSCVTPDVLWIQDGATSFRYQRMTQFSDSDDASTADRMVLAPMSGKVIALSVSAGDGVKANQPVLVIESMKMEMPIHAQSDGLVGQVHVAVGDQIAAGQILMEIEVG